MSNRMKFLNSTTAGNLPPAGAAADRGRIAFNLTDRKLWGYNPSGTPTLLAALVGPHMSNRAYAIDDLMVRDNILYRCTTAIPPKTFSAGDWTPVSDFRAELLYRVPTQIAQATMTMGGGAIGARYRAHASQAVPLAEWQNSVGVGVSDIQPDGYPGETFGRPVFRVDQIAHGFTAVGQPVRLSGANWVLANGAVAGGEAIAVVKRILGPNAVELQTTGRIDGLQTGAFAGGSIAANTRYYLSVANPGQLTTTAPPDAADENVVLHTISATSAVINIQVPVGVTPAGAGANVLATQSPNPFSAVGQVAALTGSGWARANPATNVPLGIISATAGNDFSIAVAGQVVSVAAGAAVTFPLVAGQTYYASSTGLLTDTPPTSSLLGAGPVLVAIDGTSGVVVAGQASPNGLRASQNLGDLTSVSAAITNLALNDVVRTSRTLTAGTGLTGGGTLAANRTFALNAASIASLALADTAVQPGLTLTAGTGLTGGGTLAANRTFALEGQALALHNLTGTGLLVRTGAAAFALRSLVAGDGLTGTNLTATGGNPSFAVDSTVVRTSRTLTAGDGLTGGGNLGANRSFAVDATVLRTSGFQSITSGALDIRGRLTLSDPNFSFHLRWDRFGDATFWDMSHSVDGGNGNSIRLGQNGASNFIFRNDGQLQLGGQATENNRAVRADRTLTTGTGLTGGGSLVADRTISLDLGAIPFDSAGSVPDVRAFVISGGTSSSLVRVPASRFRELFGLPVSTTTFTAGDGLTGGGTLAADRAFAVDNTVVRTSGTQTIGGTKTFSAAVVLGTQATAGTQAVRADRTLTAGTGLTGGGNLTANRTFNVDFASLAQAQTYGAAAATDKAMSPRRVLDMFNALGDAPVFACRAWVNFNGTGTVSVRNSGNVSSVTDLGVGDYRVNFAAAMLTTDYVFTAGGPSAGDGTKGSVVSEGGYNTAIGGKLTTSMRIRTGPANGTGAVDFQDINIAFFE